MRDYLRADEKNQIVIMKSFLQNTEGIRAMKDHPKITSMVDEWEKRGMLTAEERKSLKMTLTYMKKFCDLVTDRLSQKEQETIDKRLEKYDFRIVDSYTLEMLQRETSNKLKNAVVPRDQFNDWTRELMHYSCKGCNKNWNECELHEIFYENFIPESSWNKPNCRYSYGG